MRERACGARLARIGSGWVRPEGDGDIQVTANLHSTYFPFAVSPGTHLYNHSAMGDISVAPAQKCAAKHIAIIGAGPSGLAAAK
jgi:NADPH-dependent 2,4-dienoyl-CoA reductase/sulfur reductase-like enzyme